MKYGYWLPVFGGWLRNVPDERMDASWAYVSRLARRSEEIGFDLTLIAELFLNDIKGIDAPALDAWSTAAAHAANIDQISNGRLSLNVVSSWWADEARRYGVQFDQHDDRYARTAEWLDVIDGAWRQPKFDYAGKYYNVNDLIVEPKPVRSPRPTIYAGGESEAAKSLISRSCDAYVMHGDPPDRVAPKVADMSARREKLGLPPMTFGLAGYVIVRDSETEAKRELERITNVEPGSPGYANYQDWITHTKLEQQVSLQDYSVSNRGLRAGLVGTAEQVAERIIELEQVGVSLLLLQCSPQIEEMERFSETVMPLVSEGRHAAVA